MASSGTSSVSSRAPAVFEFETTDGHDREVASELGSKPRRRWRRPVLGPPLAWMRGPIRERDPRVEVARRDALYRRSLACADVLAATVAVLLGVVAFGDGLQPLALLAPALLVLAGKVGGVYDRDELLINKTTVDEAPQLFHLATLFGLLFFLLQHPFVDGALGPGQILVLWGTLFVAMLLGRRVARGFARGATSVERCLFVGGEASCERLRVKLESTGGRAVLVGRMAMGDTRHGDVVAAAAAMLHRLVDELGVHRVIIEPSEPMPQATLDFVREAKGTGARVSLLPRVLEVVGSSIELDDLDGLVLLGVRRFGLTRSSALIKRGFDAVGAAMGLVALAPLLLAVAVVIRIDSRGPAIYRQTRVGRAGRPFTMWKFRTMVEGADGLKPTLAALNESQGLFKIADDPRTTRAGRWLRRYSLDELPQLVNVLRGEMSLVGPRPLVLDDDARITGLDRRRLYLTPGMTGHWQVLGSSRVPLAEMIKLDYLYVAGWSLWTDVKILLRTVPYVLSRRGM
jgi:exopolysaccharide biosynthesis polyprenyl glycosylphosphotransferase